MPTLTRTLGLELRLLQRTQVLSLLMGTLCLVYSQTCLPVQNLTKLTFLPSLLSPLRCPHPPSFLLPQRPLKTRPSCRIWHIHLHPPSLLSPQHPSKIRLSYRILMTLNLAPMNDP